MSIIESSLYGPNPLNLEVENQEKTSQQKQNILPFIEIKNTHEIKRKKRQIDQFLFQQDQNIVISFKKKRPCLILKFSDDSEDQKIEIQQKQHNDKRQSFAEKQQEKDVNKLTIKKFLQQNQSQSSQEEYSKQQNINCRFKQKQIIFNENQFQQQQEQKNNFIFNFEENENKISVKNIFSQQELIQAISMDNKQIYSQQETPQIDDKNKQILSLYRMQKLFRKELFYKSIPKNGCFQCVITRKQEVQNFEIYDCSSLKKICKVSKTKNGFNIISIVDKNNHQIIGEIQTNYFGTQYNCFVKKQIENTVLSVKYEHNFLGLNGPRKMNIFLPWRKIIGRKDLCEIKKDVQCLSNMMPIWNNERQAFSLNFRGRVTQSSIKNFVVENQSLIFGKIGKNLFNLDIQHPFNLVQGITLAISSLAKRFLSQ